MVQIDERVGCLIVVAKNQEGELTQLLAKYACRHKFGDVGLVNRPNQKTTSIFDEDAEVAATVFLEAGILKVVAVVAEHGY